MVNPIVPIYRDAEVRYILQGFPRARVLRPADVPQLRLPRHDAAPARGAARRCARWSWCAVRRPAAASYDELLELGAGRNRPQRRTDPNAVKLVLYTSGTTGSPKGVLHSHNTIMSEIDAVIDYWGIDDRDVVLMPSPVTHITGYLYALEIAFAAGVKVVFMERWNAAEAVDLIERHGVTFSVGATPFLKELVAEVERRGLTLPSLRLFMSGGAPVPPELIYRANAVLAGLPDVPRLRQHRGADRSPSASAAARTPIWAPPPTGASSTTTCASATRSPERRSPAMPTARSARAARS